MAKDTNRRQLKFEKLSEVIPECRLLLAEGYSRHGNWSLGQICYHLRLTIESNMAGYPRWMTVLGFPLRPILKTIALPRLLAGNSPSGIRTAGIFVPPGGLEDATEVELLEICIQDFEASEEPLYAHPGFGKLSKSEFNAFHAAHAAHHLSFLQKAG